MRGLRRPLAAGALVAVLCALGALATRGRPAERAAPRQGRRTAQEPPTPVDRDTADGGAATVGGALIVHVTGLDGRAEPGATVVVAGSGLWPPREAETDDGGAAAFEGVREGVYEARAHFGREVAEPLLGIELGKDERRDVYLALEPGRAITGRVVDAATGAPIGGARLVVGEEALAVVPVVARTAADGSFTIEPLLERPYRLTVRAPGWVAEIGREVVAGAPAFEVRLHRGATLEGIVLDGRGFPVSGAALEVRGVDVGGGAVDLSSFSLAMEDADFDVLATGSGTLRPSGELGVMTGPLPPIPGAVAPPEPLPVPAGIAGGSASAGLVSSDRGEFRIEGVPPGRLIVHASHPAHASGESRTIVAHDGGAITGIEVVLGEGRRVAGRVVDPAGFPVGGASVELQTERDSPRLVVTTTAGEFAFEAIDARALVVLRSWAPDHDPTALSVPASEASDVELELRRSAEPLAGRVEDDRGFPVRGATIRLAPLEPGSSVVTAVSAEDGTFAAAVPPGVAVALEARHPEHAPTLVRSVVPARPFVVVLASGGGLEGTVVARVGGFAVSPFDLVVTGLDVGAGPPSRIRVEDLDGAFRVTNLRPGRHRLRVAAEGFAPWEDEVEVPAPRALEKITATALHVELEAGAEARGRVLDARGDPVTGARVSAGRPALLFRVSGQRPIVTDADGAFAIVQLPQAAVTLWASHPDLGVANLEVDLSRGSIEDAELAFDGALDEDTVPGGGARFGGVGVVLEGDRVVEVLEGGLAERAALRPADRIVRVNGAVVRGASLSRALRGPVGTEVVLEVRRGGAAFPVLVTRELLYR
ncbi:MAG: carboxypeptidase regulatory-like domain-containing protein [Deltaproteobacteria bacterium]|nr:carboxypeptidase regulatory-like domain-containing protein [Deltaproteobacteria bacterium]